MRPITLLSDFGDFYVGSLRGVLASRLDDPRPILDLYHDVPRQDVRAGAFVLANAAPDYPAGTVHCACVDDEVGDDRTAVVVAAGGQFLVGPDNGICLPAARRLADAGGEVAVYRATDAADPDSNLYHGRDAFAAVSADVADGRFPLTDPVEDYADLRFPDPTVADDRIRGEARYVDRFGNVITNVPAGTVLERADYGDRIAVAGREVPLADGFGRVAVGDPLAKIGSYGNLVLAVNRGSGSDAFGVDQSDDVVVRL